MTASWMPRSTAAATCLAMLLGWFSNAALANSATIACSLQAVPIQAATDEPADTYVGRTAVLEVRFHNDKRVGPIDVFPEPPLVVKRLDSQTECTIQEGGIWVRRHVWASVGGDTLVTHEYSGSNDALVFYDTRNCARTATVDLSGRRWTVTGRAIAISKPGQRKSHLALSAACLPVDPRR